MLGRTSFPPVGELPYLLTLPSYGFYWFRLAADVAMSPESPPNAMSSNMVVVISG